MRYSVAISFLLLLPCFILSAQDPRSIKEDPSYICGEASGKDYETIQSEALDALIAKLAASDILLLPSRSRIPIWNSYRTDIISASEVVGNNGTVLRYIAWKDVGRIFSRRKNLVNELFARARAASSSGRIGEAATCLEWAMSLMEALPEDKALEKRLKSARNALGVVNPMDIPSLSYIGREVGMIRSALRSGVPKAKPAAPKPPVESRMAVNLSSVRLGLPPVELPERCTEATLSYENQLVPRKTGQAVVSIEEIRPSSRLSLLALAQFTALPQVQPGLLFGVKYGRSGGYVSFRNSLHRVSEDYSCSSDGRTDFGYIWASGSSKLSGYSISGGILFGMNDWLSAYAGAGYGISSLYWEDVSGEWAMVTDKSFKGPLFEAGLLTSLGQAGSTWRISLLTGISTISFRTISPVLGIGVTLNH